MNTPIRVTSSTNQKAARPTLPSMSMGLPTDWLTKALILAKDSSLRSAARATTART